MKICILTPRYPSPENGGDIPRINNIARYLKSRRHTFVLVSYYSEADMNGRNNPPEALYDSVYLVRRSGLVSLGMSLWALVFNKPIQVGYYFSFTFLVQFKAVVRKENPDLYISPLLLMVPFLNLCHLQDKSIAGMAGALSKPYEMADGASGFSVEKIMYRIEAKRIAAYERKTAARYRKWNEWLKGSEL